VLDGRLYAFGGFTTTDLKATPRVQVYDPRTNRWMERAAMPVALTHTSAAVVGDTVWFAGGFVGDGAGPVTAAVWRYAAHLDRWLPGPSLPAPRGGGALAIVGRTLHYFGGFESDRDSDASDHWLLDVDSGTAWHSGPSMPLGRGQLGTATLNGAIYAVGGQFGHDSGARDLARVHRYDAAAERWSEVAPLPAPRSHAEGSTFDAQNEILVLGGRNNRDAESTEDELLQDIVAYDPVTDLWLDLDRLPRTTTGPVAAVLGDQLIVAGGGTGTEETAQRDAWSIKFRDVWRPRPGLPVPLSGIAGGIIGRYLYLVGEEHDGTFRYDLATGRWIAPEGLSVRPFPGSHHAAEVWGGRLYLFGGSGAERRTQIYDPQGDSWQLGAPLPFRAPAAASAVIGDKIYVASGGRGAFAASDLAVYDPANDTWERIASAPHALNGSVGGTDGQRFFLFGTRDLQVYDSQLNRWTVIRRPQDGSHRQEASGRSGAGKVVFLQGRSYLLGGRVPGAGLVSGVDIYDPIARRWERGSAMPIPREGIFPVVTFGRILVAGGKGADGNASSAFDYYTPAPIGQASGSRLATD
jgi:N-acetylneuraminic acid mutarotase